MSESLAGQGQGGRTSSADAEPAEKPEAELRRCLRDLVALSSLPIIWVGANAEQIANALAQLIVSILDVEFAWVTVNKPAISVFQSHSRARETGFVPRTPKAEWVKPNARFTTNAQLQCQMSGVSVPIGLEPGSALVALCCRSEFPTQTEHLLLRVAANQAAVAIQQWRTEQTLRLEMKQREALEARERQLRSRETQRELAHANRVATMGHLTASLAHELKQPLAAVVMTGNGTLKWLTRYPPEIEEAKQSAEAIIKYANRAIHVIDRIHGLAKKEPPRTDIIDLNDAIREVITLIHAEAAKNGVAVQTNLADHLPRIQGDRVQLQQVMLNLTVNAIQAMSVLAEGERELQVTTARNEEGVHVAVQDTGPGLSSENFDRLFEPFYTTKRDGMGLGLSICRSIIEAHAGRLWATACEPHGTLFQFTIPCN